MLIQKVIQVRLARGFVRLGASLLFAISLAKLIAAAGDARVLSALEPVTGLPNHLILIVAATLELGVAAICFFRSTVDGLLAIAWLSVLLVAYRAGLWWIGWKKPCSCLGNLTDALHISPQLADNVMKGLLAFMLFGSVSLLFMHWHSSRSPQGGGQEVVASGCDEGVSSI